jgi:hypothetical protein
MGHNLLVLALSALIPLIVGSAWYSPLLFAKPWMAATGMTPEKAKNSSMVVSMILLYVFSFLIAVSLAGMVVHQLGLNSMLQDPKIKDSFNDPNSDFSKALAVVWGALGHSFRTYRHGAFHGALAAIFFALPLIASCAVFEQRGWKYIMITWGFWLINLMLMGAVICHWMQFDTLRPM